MVGKKLTWMNKQHFKRKLNSEEGLGQLAARLQEQLTQQHGHLSRLVVHSESMSNSVKAVCRVQRSPKRVSSIYSCFTGDERMGVDYLKKVLLLLEVRPYV